MSSMRLRLDSFPLAVPADADARRVLVAIALYADEEGLTCREGDDALADSASVPRGRLITSLRSLAGAGWIRTLIVPDGHPGAGRVIVLMDHEALGWYVAETLRSIRLFRHARR